jgi:hypothetical protein
MSSHEEPVKQVTDVPTTMDAEALINNGEQVLDEVKEIITHVRRVTYLCGCLPLPTRKK